VTRPVHVVPPDVLQNANTGDVITLGGSEGRHASTVRRIRVGEQLDVVDGEGARALVTVTAVVDASTLELSVENVARDEVVEPRVVVVQALAKGDRGETAVETLTEVGVDAIVPWQAERCVVRWESGKRTGLDRWRRVAGEASKQSRRSRFCDVAEVVTLADLVPMVRSSALALVLHEEADIPLAGHGFPNSGDIMLIVGPEGGITEHEREVLSEAGAVVVRLGPTVLRTSTAGTAAAAVVLAATERWSVK